jgi:tRNA(adenine34) deaminase
MLDPSTGLILPLDDEHFMRHALREAEQAFKADEVPVGAVVVCNAQIIGRAHNLTERLNDVTAHAEMQAITAAAGHLGGKYLKDCALYVTLEPCVMCAGALQWAQVARIVFGAFDEKAGYRRLGGRALHPKTQVIGGILEAECGDLMKAFFRKKRSL